jgi:hypothetical protein
MSEGIEPRNNQEVGKADVVTDAESYILVIVMVRLSRLLRGLRPWHVTHSYDTATRETLAVLTRMSMAIQVIIKQGGQMTDRESDYSIVPLM